ncbi:MAG TPA: ABC transporter permease subunit [Fimbriimonas sp.]|nr:ABC transporter permease subunit [Fimbriimonas sp.]
MEGYIYGSMLRELFRFRRIAPWLLVVLAVYGMSLVFQKVTSGTPQDSYVLVSATLVFRILPLAAAILSAAVVAQEIEQRTIVYLLTRPVPRWKLLLFRTLAAITVVFVLGSIVAFAASLGTAGLKNEMLVRDLKAILVGSIAYVSLFTFISLLMNRSMIVCLLFAFIWETAVPNMPGDLYLLTITGYLSSIAERPSLGQSAGGVFDALAGMLGTNSVSPTIAWAALLCLTAACLGVGCLWFSHFEYMAREDAE